MFIILFLTYTTIPKKIFYIIKFEKIRPERTEKKTNIILSDQTSPIVMDRKKKKIAEGINYQCESYCTSHVSNALFSI